MSDFDQKAAEWDSNPMHWERSEAIAKEIMTLIPLKKEMTALEFGAGTGITSFLLKEYLREITLMDNSSEMIKVINEKISATGAKNIKAVNFDLVHTDFVSEKFDFIFSQMVLHHISSTEDILDKFRNMIKKGGYLALADLCKEDGSFHGDGFTGHKGFDTQNLSELLKKRNFTVISCEKCFVLRKETADGEIKNFDVFLLIGQKGS